MQFSRASRIPPQPTPLIGTHLRSAAKASAQLHSTLHIVSHANTKNRRRRGIELPDPGDPLQVVKELWGTERPATARHALGTAPCGPARGVAWGLGG